MNTPHEDARLIEKLGGPAKLAELLGYPKDGGVQRVHNWITRGIPPAVKVERPELFLPPPSQRSAASPAPIAVRRDGTVVEKEERGTAKHKEEVFLRTFENRRARGE